MPPLELGLGFMKKISRFGAKLALSLRLLTEQRKMLLGTLKVSGPNMTYKTVKITLASGTFAMMSTAAQAVTIMSTPLIEVASGGGAYNGQIDLSSILTDAGGKRYRAVSATLIASGYSDAQYNLPTYRRSTLVEGSFSYISGYEPRRGECDRFGLNCKIYNVPVYKNGPIYRITDELTYTDTLTDQMLLTSGDDSASSSVNDMGMTSTPAILGGNFVYETYRGSLYYQKFYGGNFGDLSASLNLSGQQLDKLNTVGLLSYSVAAPVGRFTINQVSLAVELSSLPAVPEPATWMMMIAGFGLTGVALRGQRRRSVVKAVNA